jgi:ribosomal protein S17E
MEEGLENKIELEKQIRSGKKIAFVESTIDPHSKNKKDYAPSSVKLIIDRIIEKFDQNYDENQYTMGTTISLIYLHTYIFPLYTSGCNAIVPVYSINLYDNGKVPVTGELWAAAFGNTGMPIFRCPGFEGKKNIEGYMEYEGILRGDRFCAVKALCFCIESINHITHTVALSRYHDDEIKYLVSKITDKYNDEFNSQAYRLIK